MIPGPFLWKQCNVPEVSYWHTHCAIVYACHTLHEIQCWLIRTFFHLRMHIEPNQHSTTEFLIMYDNLRLAMTIVWVQTSVTDLYSKLAADGVALMVQVHWTQIEWHWNRQDTVAPDTNKTAYDLYTHEHVQADWQKDRQTDRQTGKGKGKGKESDKYLDMLLVRMVFDNWLPTSQSSVKLNFSMKQIVFNVMYTLNHNPLSMSTCTYHLISFNLLVSTLPCKWNIFCSGTIYPTL